MPATEERDRRLREDRAAIRGLQALQGELADADGPGTYTATKEERNVSASVDIMRTASGGFLISTLAAEADYEDAE